MLSAAASLLLALIPSCLALGTGKSGKCEGTSRMTCTGGTSFINYTTVSGFFLQDQATTNPRGFDYITTNYGLINRGYPTDSSFDPDGKKTQWQRFEHYVETLNRDADKNTQYKLLYMMRHGEGFHNAAEAYYGTPAWNCYWSELDGKWHKRLGRRFSGIDQTTKANRFWRAQLTTEGTPAPDPLSRCTTTANLTLASLALPADRPFVPVVKELLREGISMHTCDRRSNKTYIQKLFAGYRFEEGFTEQDEQWNGTFAETGAAQNAQSKAVLDDIFSNDGKTWISITSHSGEIRSLLSVLGHRPFSLSTGQAIPVLVRARNNRKMENPTPATGSWVLEPTCTSPPVTSGAAGCVCATASSTLRVASSPLTRSVST
ncbi:phosphoglycerate mutase [Apiospora phragmitis]|uniref:Phosphoglycerate mutase n=1 Tax=Apiospora phragmitis TaxID=2905665 RepID=A0ABR1SVZ9_9PEZI